MSTSKKAKNANKDTVGDHRNIAIGILLLIILLLLVFFRMFPQFRFLTTTIGDINAHTIGHTPSVSRIEILYVTTLMSEFYFFFPCIATAVYLIKNKLIPKLLWISLIITSAIMFIFNILPAILPASQLTAPQDFIYICEELNE